MSDLWQHSVLHRGCSSLLLKELEAPTVSCRGARGVVHDWCQLGAHPSLTHHLYGVSPRQSQTFRLVCWFSSCPSLSLRRWPMPPELKKKLPCTHRRTSVSSSDGDDFDPSCCVSSPGYCWSERAGICAPPRSPCPNPACSPVQSEKPSFWMGYVCIFCCITLFLSEIQVILFHLVHFRWLCSHPRNTGCFLYSQNLHPTCQSIIKPKLCIWFTTFSIAERQICLCSWGLMMPHDVAMNQNDWISLCRRW